MPESDASMSGRGADMSSRKKQTFDTAALRLPLRHIYVLVVQGITYGLGSFPLLCSLLLGTIVL